MRAPTRSVIIIISSMSMTYNTVGHGRSAVRRRFNRRSGVVIALYPKFSHHSWVDVSEEGHLSVDISNVEDLTVLAMYKRVGSKEFHFNGSSTKI